MKNKFQLLLITACTLALFLVSDTYAGKWRNKIASTVAIATVKVKTCSDGVCVSSSRPVEVRQQRIVVRTSTFYLRPVRRIKW